MRTTKSFAYAVFVVLGILWGSNFLFMKLAVAVLLPIQVVCLRIFFGTLPILIFATFRMALSWKDFRNSHQFFLMGLLGTVFPYYCLVKGTQYLPSGIAGVFSGLVPLLTAILVALALPTEKLTWKSLVGLVFGILGVVLVVKIEPGPSMDTNNAMVGTGFMLLGSLSFAAAMVHTRKYITPLRLGSLQLTAYQMLFSLAMMLIITPSQGIFEIVNHPEAFLGVVFGLGLFGTGCAFVIFYFLIERLGAVTASAVYYLPPVAALIVGGLFLHESINGVQILGAFSIVMGIYFARDGSVQVK